MKKRLPFLIALILLAGAAVWFFWLRPATGDERRLVLYGNVDIRQVDLGFRVPGRIAQMRFEEGDSVSPGDILATLDAKPYRDDVDLAQAELAAQQASLRKYKTGARPEEIAQARAQVAERQATLDNAKLILERQRVLLERSQASQQAYDNALAQKTEAAARLKSAQQALGLALKGFREEDIAAAAAGVDMATARLARAETALEDTQLRAPSGGVILSRIEEQGAIVASGAPVYTLSLTTPVWVRAYVSEPDLGRIHPGMKVRVMTDSAPDHPYEGHIGFISPVAEFTPKTVQTADLRTDLVYRLRVIIDDADDGLRQGMPVTVDTPDAAGGA